MSPKHHWIQTQPLASVLVKFSLPVHLSGPRAAFLDGKNSGFSYQNLGPRNQLKEVLSGLSKGSLRKHVFHVLSPKWPWPGHVARFRPNASVPVRAPPTPAAKVVPPQKRTVPKRPATVTWRIRRCQRGSLDSLDLK